MRATMESGSEDLCTWRRPCFCVLGRVRGGALAEARGYVMFFCCALMAWIGLCCIELGEGRVCVRIGSSGATTDRGHDQHTFASRHMLWLRGIGIGIGGAS